MYRAMRQMRIWTALFAVGLIAAMGVNNPAMAMDDQVIQIGPEQLYSDAQVWKVWCDDKDHCTVAGKPAVLNTIIREMPIATWGYCRREFCYGDAQLSDVIGLNPKYYTD